MVAQVAPAVPSAVLLVLQLASSRVVPLAALLVLQLGDKRV